MTAVTWVAGTDFTQATSTTVAANAPAGLSNGDTLLAAVYARSTITPPSGWTLVCTTGDFTDGVRTQRLSVYSKTSVTTGDSSASFTWTQATSNPIGVCYAAVQGAAGTPGFATVVVDNDSSGDLAVLPTNVPATAPDQIIIVFGSVVDGQATTSTPEPPSSVSPFFTLITQASATDYRLAGAYRPVSTGQGVTADLIFDLFYFGSDTFGYGAVTLLMTDGAGPVATEVSYLTVPGPLGAPAITAAPGVATVTAAAGPLGAPQLTGEQDPVALISCASPLGIGAVRVFWDFGPYLVGATQRYVMDLTHPGGTLRIPISSWQATLQTEQANYVQCVIPACAPYIDELTTATSFGIRRISTLSGFGSFEVLIAETSELSLSITKSPSRQTAVLSGYSDAFLPEEDPPAALDRPLLEIRQITTSSGGRRVRCAMDWILRPSNRALVQGEPMIVAFMNLYVNENDAFMDVGERIT